MYLHIGNNFMLYSKNIIAMMDKSIFGFKVNEKFIQRLYKRKRVVRICNKSEIKSVVLTDDGLCYITNISVRTLNKRFGKKNFK